MEMSIWKIPLFFFHLGKHVQGMSANGETANGAHVREREAITSAIRIASSRSIERQIALGLALAFDYLA